MGLHTVFDLTLLPFHITAGRLQPDFPGLLAIAPPRRSDRHRAGDLLAALLSAPNGQALPEDLPGEALQVLSNTYYSTSGTLTSALKAAVEALNDSLLSHGGRNGQLVVLNIVALRGNLVYIAHVGPAHTFVLNRDTVQHYYDPQSAGRGLGASRSINLRFFHAEVAPGDLLLFSVEPPVAWTPASLAGSTQLGLESLRRRLTHQAPPEVKAGLVQIQEGSGKITRGQFPTGAVPQEPAPAQAPAMSPAASIPTPQAPPLPAAQPPVQPPASMPVPSEPLRPLPELNEILPGSESDPEEESPAVAAARRRIAERRARQNAAADTAGASPRTSGGLASLFNRAQPAAAEAALPGSPADFTPAAAEPVSEPLGPKRRGWIKPLANFIRRVRTARQHAGRGTGSFLTRLLPGAANQPMSLPSTTMFFIAIAVPVVVVAVALTVYIYSGQGQQRVVYLQQAQAYAQQASQQNDPTLKRNAWSQAAYWAQKADNLGSDENSQALQNKAQSALDSIDGIVRLSLTPAFNGIMPTQVTITHMAATGSELFLLDSTSGRILHLTLAGRSYEFDPNFNCGPGPAGGKIIGPLVGMAALPLTNDFNASVLGVDATGNLLYCVIGDVPQSATLSQPENNWGKITGMTMFNGNLYVLDQQNNAVWRFDGDNYNYGGRPRLFFGNEVPNLSDVIDLTVYQDDLYLLRGSGKITVCTSSGFDFSPTRCSDPATYNGKGGPVESYTDARFTQLMTTLPPDPSLFILDAKGPAIYHFSLRLNYQRQLRQDSQSDFPLPSHPVTAFTIAPTRMIFMAFGNQIYFGALP